MRPFVRTGCGLLLATLAANCGPPFARHDLQPSGPAASTRPEDLELLRSPTYRSVHGASAGELPGGEPLRKRAVANALATDYIRRHEGPLYRRRDGGPSDNRLPHVCVALSGGGMRALAFDTGVLYGLQASGLFPKVNVLSASSGGGFASFWLIANVARGSSEAEVLSGAGSPALLRLRDHASDLDGAWAKTEMAITFGSADLQYEVALTAKDGTVHVVGQSSHSTYGGVIEQMLAHSVPFGVPTALPEEDLYALVSTARVPVPVWLAAARPMKLPQCVGSDPLHEVKERSADVSYTAFELGPTRMGSDSLGFVTHMLMPPIDAVSASAAAMGLPFNERCGLLHAIDATLAVVNFPTRSAPEADATTSQAALPVNAPFGLTDGGLADNLALVPLVRRLCSDIIVVDATFDPYLVFDDYGYIKQKLARLNIELSVPALEEVAAHNRVPPSRCSDGVCFVGVRPECARRMQDSGCIASDQLPNPVFEGTIGAIPLAQRGADPEDPWVLGERTLRVHYIKLAFDGRHLERYPATIRGQYQQEVARRAATAANGCSATGDAANCSFPHLLTSDLDFKGAKFEAYWDLGRCLAQRDWNAAVQAPDRCADAAWPP